MREEIKISGGGGVIVDVAPIDDVEERQLRQWCIERAQALYNPGASLDAQFIVDEAAFIYAFVTGKPAAE